MKIGIIGSGMVAQAIAPKMLELGNEVMISARDTNMEKSKNGMKLPSVNAWVYEMTGKKMKASGGSYFDAARFGELIFNCTSGAHSMESLQWAGYDNLKGKIMIDLANPLDFSSGSPVPQLTVCNSICLAETLQNTFRETKVVKALNHVSSMIMTNPGKLSEDTVLFMAGNDAEAKKFVSDTVLKKWFGWENVMDLGGLEFARGMEMYLPLWASVFKKLGNATFNMKLVTGKKSEKTSSARVRAVVSAGTGRKLRSHNGR